jgi:hypothetical protein
VSRRTLVGFLAVMLATRLVMIGSAAYDPDEFEHLHAGLMLSQGAVPYRDFFEHHGPLTYLFGALSAKVVGAMPILLDVNRGMALVFTGLTCLAVYRLAERVTRKRSAPWSLVWLLTFPWFAGKSLEWRPDVVAMAFIALGAWMAAERRTMTAGMFVGLATLCTQKSAALGLGIAVAAVWDSADWKKSGLRLVLGALTPWMVAATAFAVAGGLGSSLWCLFYVPAIWPMKVSVGRELFVLALRDGPASLALGVAAWGAAWGSRRGPKETSAPHSQPLSHKEPMAWDVVRFAILLHWLAWPFMPAAYLQFHLLGLPLLAVAVARFVRRPLVRTRRRPKLAWGTLLLVLLIPNGVWFYQQLLVFPQAAPVTRGIQLDALLELAERTPITARVQDGFTGVACLHQSADYWWWVNEHSLALMDRLDELKHFRARLRRNPPDVYLVDASLRKVLEPIERDVTRSFQETSRNDALRFLLLEKR